MRRFTCVLVFGLLLAGTGLAFSQAAPPHRAKAAATIFIPTNQKSCATDEESFNSSGAPDGVLKVTVNNGLVARNVKVETSSETLVQDSGGLLLIDYLVDGVFMHIGPEFFSSDNLNWGSRSSMGIITLGPGVHTIQPYFTYSGSNLGFVFFRCLSAEKNTN